MTRLASSRASVHAQLLQGPISSEVASAGTGSMLRRSIGDSSSTRESLTERIASGLRTTTLNVYGASAGFSAMGWPAALRKDSRGSELYSLAVSTRLGVVIALNASTEAR